MQWREIEPERNTFKSIVADITHRCNMKCANCYIPNRSLPDMDKERLRAFLKRLPSKTFIRLIGAEPTVRRDLPEIIRIVKEAGHHPSLTTNGLKLASFRYTQRLYDSGMRMFLVSMNGADDDSVYQVMDGGSYAEKKTQALENLFRLNALVNVGCILAKGVNEDMAPRLVSLVSRAALKFNRRFNGSWRSPCIRFKNIGAIGRSMKGRDISFSKLKALVARSLGLSPGAFVPCEEGSNLTAPIEPYKAKEGEREGGGAAAPRASGERAASLAAAVDSGAGKILIRLIDWSVDESGVPLRGSENRGRITQNWKIAPFFEHKKANEMGY